MAAVALAVRGGVARLPEGAELAADGGRRLPGRHRLHHEPVHRLARLRERAEVTAVRVGVIAGSLVSAVLGVAILFTASRRSALMIWPCSASAVFVLLPVADLMAFRLESLPVVAGAGDAVSSAASKIATARVRPSILPTGRHRHGTGHWLNWDFRPRGQPHRLQMGEAIGLGAMRQKGILAIGPQQWRERFGSLLRSCLHHHPPAPFETGIQQPGQDLFERLALEMVEEDFGHRGFAAQGAPRVKPLHRRR